MTTGCACGTPGCGGIAPTPGGSCARCQIEAMPSGLARTAREVLYGVLYGRDLEGGPFRLIRNDWEAGS